MNNPENMESGLLAETAHYSVWEVQEPDGETTIHLELNQLTLHFFREEWNEFKQLIGQVKGK